MAYAKLLEKIINDTNLSNVEISQKCKELGINVDRSYINKLLNNKSKPPKEDISRAIAQVCGADERLLVLEGYIDKAPKEIKETLQQIRFLTSLAALNIFENNFNNQNNKFLEQFENELNNEPLANFIINILDKKATDINFNDVGIEFSEKKDNYNVTLTAPVELKANDNAMFPIITENSYINLTLKDKYNNGDIIALKIKGKEDLLIRYIFYNGQNILLTAISQNYAPINCKENDILILGKVTKVITKL